jgi:hypothetical protein
MGMKPSVRKGQDRHHRRASPLQEKHALDRETIDRPGKREVALRDGDAFRGQVADGDPGPPRSATGSAGFSPRGRRRCRPGRRQAPLPPDALGAHPAANARRRPDQKSVSAPSTLSGTPPFARATPGMSAASLPPARMRIRPSRKPRLVQKSPRARSPSRPLVPFRPALIASRRRHARARAARPAARHGTSAEQYACRKEDRRRGRRRRPRDDGRERGRGFTQDLSDGKAPRRLRPDE